MIEASIAALVVFTLLFTIFESALVGRAFLAARYGASSGARAGALASNDSLADYDSLRAIEKAASVTSSRSINKVIIFKASGPGDSVPEACHGGAVDGLCNVYSSADFSRPETEFGPGGWTADDHWAPSSRQTSRSFGTDYLGVYVEVTTGVSLAALPKQLTDVAIVRIEDTGN